MLNLWLKQKVVIQKLELSQNVGIFFPKNTVISCSKHVLMLKLSFSRILKKNCFWGQFCPILCIRGLNRVPWTDELLRYKNKLPKNRASLSIKFDLKSNELHCRGDFSIQASWVQFVYDKLLSYKYAAVHSVVLQVCFFLQKHWKKWWKINKGWKKVTAKKKWCESIKNRCH